MKKTAVLIDGGFLRVKIKQALRANRRANGQALQRPDGTWMQIHELISAADYAQRVVRFAHNCIDATAEEIFRVFYYDCPPYDGGPSRIKPHPLGAQVPIVEPAAVSHQKQFLDLLRREEFFAIRSGEVSFDGWIPREDALLDVIQQGRAFVATDFKPLLRQKGTDLKIGLDTATMSADRIVDRLVLVACDSDLVPAMKLARRNGVQIVLISLGAQVKKLLKEHADIYRRAVY